MTDLIERAHVWIAGDPDPDTRDELESLVASGEVEELAGRLDTTLEFGTAGLRGEVGAGPNRMNLAMVIKATAGLAAYLGEPAAPVVVGFDARPDSERFAQAAAGVLCAAGIAVRFFPEPTPTPLVAFAAKHLDAAAAIVVTASHNPPADNGYKVYAKNAAQIIPPADVEIAARIRETGPANQIPRHHDVFTDATSLADPLGEEIFDAYWSEVARIRTRTTGSHLDIAYTPIHGVGAAPLGELFRRAGHDGLVVVPEQSEPDGRFPTVRFPNPEEPGALDLARDLGRRIGADLILANDPDADRLAAMTPVDGGFRLLSGNDLGVVLADYVLNGRPSETRPIVVRSVVSSPMMDSVAKHHGALAAVTLTGFKWIGNAGLALEEAGEGRFVFGFEEALGYTIGGVVRDKDGLSAALFTTDLVADLRDGGDSLLDRLKSLWAEHGMWTSAQVATPGEPERLVAAVDLLAASPPARLGGVRVTGITDYRVGEEGRPPWLGKQDLVELSLGELGRVLVRPSGTEPKLKIYADLRDDPGPDPLTHHQELSERAVELGRALAGVIGG